ncbi:type II toxin-antitoxin system VapC family toxin [Pseudoxanthomonas winnipegensis]|uniref:type II toxin-antitoxin system VapC family toxin n=1 Tax=Pseudoxanthomonas winnipegensis TaxID=2480810 RepID=UPI0030F43BB7
MIILDTNVLSEWQRPLPDARAVDWLKQQMRSDLFTTAITRGEMLYGARLLPEGRRRTLLLQEIEAIFSQDMAGHVLPYDAAAADAFAEIAARCRALGRPTGQADMMIAGIVRAHGATLATRNVRDFADCGIALVDPWH